MKKTIGCLLLGSVIAVCVIVAICVARPYCGEWRFAMSDMYYIELDAQGEVIQPHWQPPICDEPDVSMQYVPPYKSPLSWMTCLLSSNGLAGTICKANGPWDDDGDFRETLMSLEVSANLSNIPVFTARVTSESSELALRTIRMLQDSFTRALGEGCAQKYEWRLRNGDIEQAKCIMRIRTLSLDVAPKRLLDFRRFEKPDNSEYWSRGIFKDPWRPRL